MRAVVGSINAGTAVALENGDRDAVAELDSLHEVVRVRRERIEAAAQLRRSLYALGVR